MDVQSAVALDRGLLYARRRTGGDAVALELSANMSPKDKGEECRDERELHAERSASAACV